MSLRKELKFRIFNCDPTGIVVNERETSLYIIDDNECTKIERLYITIGNHTYSINEDGEIIDKLT